MTANVADKNGAVCPGQDELAAFAVGKLPGPSLEKIALHLQACDACSSSLHALQDQSDFLLVALRTPLPAEPWEAGESSRVQELAVHLGARFGPHLDRTPALSPVAELGQLGQYQLLARLGAGGMGQVFQARHALMERAVALKVLHPHRLTHPEAVTRFRREIRALARLDHPNIVRAYDADQVGDSHFLVMEYVAGTDLARLVRERGPLPAAEACALIRQAAAGLQHAHDHGLIHRDVKPSNLLLTPEGQVKVLDLGLALIPEEPPDSGDQSQPGNPVGTVDYMAPEQWAATGPVDGRADVYGLGCTLYHLLTGRPPYSGPTRTTRLEKMHAHAFAPIPALKPFRPEVSDELEAVIRRALAKNPADRYASPAALSEALWPFASREERRAADRKPPSGQWKPGRRMGLAAALLLGVAGLCFLIWFSGLGGGPARREVGGAEDLRVVDMRVSLYRGDPAEPLGDVGFGSPRPKLETDDVRLFIRLNAPASCYLIALNPNGQEHRCYPADDAAPPPLTPKLNYPPDQTISGEMQTYFSLDDGAGVQVFILLASRRQLPPYREWRARLGAIPPKPDELDEVWRFDGAHLEPLGGTRGPIRGRNNSQNPLQQLCQFFKNRPEFDAVEIWAFPVEP